MAVPTGPLPLNWDPPPDLRRFENASRVLITLQRPGECDEEHENAQGPDFPSHGDETGRSALTNTDSSGNARESDAYAGRSGEGGDRWFFGVPMSRMQREAGLVYSTQYLSRELKSGLTGHVKSHSRGMRRHESPPSPPRVMTS